MEGKMHNDYTAAELVNAARTPATHVSERSYHAQDGLHFERLADGHVAIVKVHPSGVRAAPHGARELIAVIDPGIWASIVLTMSAFNERPNDWHRFLDHHHGRNDLLPPL
jgi:hypothetical protein